MRISTILALAGALFLAACGRQVDIPPGYVGKVIGANGISEGSLPPGRSRLSACSGICDQVFLIENTDYAAMESIDFITPIEKLRFSVDVRGTFRLRNNGDSKTIDQIVSRVTPDRYEGWEWPVITMKKIYDIYAQNVIREVVRAELSKYTIDESLKNREVISNNLFVAVQKALERTPIELIQFGLAKADPPEVITKANELKSQREVEIAQAKLEADIILQKAEGQRLAALKQQEIDLINAETQLLVEKKLADGFSPAWAMAKYLEFLNTAAKNGNTIFMPYGSISEAPAQIAAWQESLRRSHIPSSEAQK